MALQVVLDTDPFGTPRPDAYARLTAYRTNLEVAPGRALATLSIYADREAADAAKNGLDISPVERRDIELPPELAAMLADGGRAVVYGVIKALPAYKGAKDV